MGRPTLAACLASLRACDPQPDEVLVVAQGPAPGLEELIGAAGLPDARLLRDPGRGVSRNRNLGLQRARHPVVLMTDDDCTVAPDWVATAVALARRFPGHLLTGQVRPAGAEADRVPSAKVDPQAHDFTGELEPGALYSGNMVLPREPALAVGGFDERFGPREAGEDCEFALRWLRAGLPLRYEPTLVVEHHDWRSNDELRGMYVRYWRGLGATYGKHLRRGDPAALRLLVRDTARGLRGVAAALAGRRGPDDWRRGLRGLPGGVLFGLRRLG